MERDGENESPGDCSVAGAGSGSWSWSEPGLCSSDALQCSLSHFADTLTLSPSIIMNGDVCPESVRVCGSEGHGCQGRHEGIGQIIHLHMHM